MWFTLLIILVCIIVIPIGLVVFLAALLALMPIYLGGSGYYRQGDYVVTGWAKAFAGLLGVVFEFTDAGSKLQVVLWNRVIWQPKEDTEEAVQQTFDQTTSGRAETQDTAPDDVKTESVIAKPLSDGQETSAETESVTDTEGPATEFRIPQTDSEHRTLEQKKKEELSATPSDLPSDENTPSKWARLKALWRQFSRYLDYWDGARPVLFRFLKRLMRILSFRYIDIQAVYGASDPAQTGRLFGYVEAIRPLLGNRTKLILTPDFTASRIEGAGAVEVAFHLYRLLWAISALCIRGAILGAQIWWRERQIKRSSVLNEV